MSGNMIIMHSQVKIRSQIWQFTVQYTEAMAKLPETFNTVHFAGVQTLLFPSGNTSLVVDVSEKITVYRCVWLENILNSVSQEEGLFVNVCYTISSHLSLSKSSLVACEEANEAAATEQGFSFKLSKKIPD